MKCWMNKRGEQVGSKAQQTRCREPPRPASTFWVQRGEGGLQDDLGPRARNSVLHSWGEKAVLYSVPLLFVVLNCLDKRSGALLNPRSHLTPFKVCLRIALTDLCAKTLQGRFHFCSKRSKQLVTRSSVSTGLDCSGSPKLCGLECRVSSSEKAMHFRQRTQ